MKSKVWKRVKNVEHEGRFTPNAYYAGFGMLWHYKATKSKHEADISAVFDNDGPLDRVYPMMFATDQFCLYTGKAKTPKAIYASMKRAKIFE